MVTNANTFPAYLALFKVTLRQMFWTRRTVLILIGCALSLFITLIFRFTVGGRVTINRFIPQITLILYGLLVNLCAIFYGTAIISDEIDGKGLTYLQMRPLRKSMILLSKFAAYLVGVLAIIACISPNLNRHCRDTRESWTKTSYITFRYEPALHRINGIVAVNVWSTCCRTGSEVQASCPMGVVVCDGMGTYYRSTVHAGRDQEALYITLPFDCISTL